VQALEISGLGKRFGRVQALRDVSFAVAPGEVFGYLGPTGAGKTTTLRIVLGLVRADAGAVRLLGGPPGLAAGPAAVGFLPGELNLDGRMTGAAVLDYFGGFRPGRPPVLRDRLLEAFGVSTDTLHRRVKHLSHGTRQKLGLILAMQHDPELLLLDEPTIGLDPLVQKAFQAEVAAFATRGRAVLFSSHVLSEVESVCSRVAILRGGEIVAEESIAALRDRMLRRLHVRFKEHLPDGLGAVPGVARLEQSGLEATLWIRGDVNPILRHLAASELDRFVFPEPQLEDIFHAYYQETGHART